MILSVLFRLPEPLPLPAPLPEPVYRPLPRPGSPLDYGDVTQRVRQQSLLSRFNDMFATDRLDAMDILRRFSDDHENNQRIVFTVIQVSGYFYDAS